MSDIDKLESRITAALDRIRQGVAQMSDTAARAAEPVPEVEDETAALRFQLTEEQTVNEQLEARLQVFQERQDAAAGELAAKTQTIAALEAEIEKLRAANAQLEAAHEPLKDGTQDTPELERVNREALAEIAALKAQRVADAADVDAIIAELKPLIEEA